MSQTNQKSTEGLDQKVYSYRRELAVDQEKSKEKIASATAQLLDEIIKLFENAGVSNLDEGYKVRMFRTMEGFMFITSDYREKRVNVNTPVLMANVIKNTIKMLIKRGFQVLKIFPNFDPFFFFHIRDSKNLMYRESIAEYYKPHWEITYIPPDEDD
jgi:hypothetical protein